uniref:Uncharacterized protein n=1 Tax=Rhizophora mucronata TaxID=61149 RepID=A0A2P2R2V6_RHIMU
MNNILNRIIRLYMHFFY